MPFGTWCHMVTSGQHLSGVTQSVFVLWFLWLLLALSSYVRIEPAPYDVLGSGLLVAFLILGLRIPHGVRAPIFCLSIFMLANIIAGMCAPDPVHTLRSMFVRFYLIVSWFFFTCLIYENPIRVYEVIWGGYIFAAIITVFVGVLVVFGFVSPSADSFWSDDQGRASGLFKDPNVFGPYLVPVALYTLTRMIDGSGLRLLAMGALFVWFGFGILVGFSRGAWLNLGVSFMVAIALRFYTERRLAQSARSFVRAGILLGAASLVVISATSGKTIGEMFETRAKLVQSYDTDRFANQAKIVEKVLVNPIGIGPGRAEDLETFGHAPHNLFLHVLIESGWFGAVAFYAFLTMTLWRGLNFCMQPTVIQNIYIIVFACTVGTLTQSLFIDSTHWRHMFLLFGMLWGPLLAWQADRAAFLSLRRSSVGF
jgi:O-antigen ligase